VRRLSILATVAALAAPSHAFAQATDAVASETLFRDGKRLLDQKDFAHACPKLAESFRLEAATGTLLALAMCHEGEGKIASAWAEYGDAAARARREGRADREQAALQWAGTLEPNLSTLVLSVSEAVAKTPGLVVKRDGVPIGAAAWGTPVPIDPGDHVVEVSAPGKVTWSQTISMSASSLHEALVVAPLRDEPALPASPPPTTGVSGWQEVGLVAGGLGIVALGVGAVFGLEAIRMNNVSYEGCTANLCDPAHAQTRIDARTDGNVSTVAFAAGGALLAGGAILYFTMGEPRGARGSVRAVTVATPSMLGVRVGASF
jgi:hypothetical protein